MMNFLKNFFSGEKTAEEQALAATQSLKKKHDVISIDGAPEPEEEEDCKPSNTCCGGGCR